MHFQASPKSTELLKKSVSVLNMQEVSNMNWYQSLWFKHFLGAAKDYSYFFFEGGGGRGGARTKLQNNFFNFVF